MAVRDHKGCTAMDRLIAKLPDAAMVVLDHCVERTTRDDDDPTLTMVFDYQYIDPGPDDPSFQHNKYFALNTMVRYENDRLLSHPLCQNILSQKWVRFGRRTFYWNLVIYILYLLFLNLYIATVDDALTDKPIDDVNRCPIMLNYTDEQLDKYILEGEPNSDELRNTLGQRAFVYGLMSQILVVIIILKEFFKIYSQKVFYFFNLFNWIAWILLASTFAFTYPGNKIPCIPQWRAGWISAFFAWINFIMYLRRIDFVGIYVIMFVTVLISLMKAILLFLFFSCAFASAFYIVMSKHDEAHHEMMVGGVNTSCAEPKMHTHFQPLHHGILNVFVMSLGEIEKVGSYLEIAPKEFAADVQILMALFLFLMPIVLMNLLIGIAVGDIEKVQHNAYLKRIALQVDILYQIENNMPKFMQRKAYIRRATIKPNDVKTGAFDKAIYKDISKSFRSLRRYLFGSSRDVQFIQAEQKDKQHHLLDRMGDQLFTQQQRIKNMNALLQQQTLLLQQIGQKLNISEFHTQDPMGLETGGPFGDQSSLLDRLSLQDRSSLYDNVSLGGGGGGSSGGKGVGRGGSRYKSVRQPGVDRPSSVHI